MKISHLKSAIQGTVLFVLTKSVLAIPVPLSQFAQCVASKQCDQTAESNVLSCCKSCLSTIHFGSQKVLQTVMHEHLDLVCSQFQKPAMITSVSAKKPYIKVFLLGSYIHTSGKDGCNKDQVMWSAPINLYHHNDGVVGATNKHSGIIRVYPLSRCEDRQVGEVVSSHQLNIKVSGKKVRQNELLNLQFSNSISTHKKRNAASEKLVNLVDELASLSFNPQNEALKQWTLDEHSSLKNPVKYFTTNDEANDHGWKGKTDVFVEEVSP